MQKIDQNSSSEQQIEFLTKSLSLVPHTDGAYYSFPEPYECQDKVKVDKSRYKGEEVRKASTFVYKLLKEKDICTWHRLRSDEMWHFYEGTTTCTIYIYDPVEKKLTTKKLGNKLKDNTAEFFAVMPNGTWFAGKLDNQNQGNYCLLGCTVAPGFEWQDFEMIDKESLEKHAEALGKLI